MGRLIDADTAAQYMPFDEAYVAIHFLGGVPTVEAIPKADIQKALKEGSKDISENILAIVREEYISKADYENRLKADLVAMLTELKKEIDEIPINPNTSKGFKLGQATA